MPFDQNWWLDGLVWSCDLRRVSCGEVILYLAHYLTVSSIPIRLGLIEPGPQLERIALHYLTPRQALNAIASAAGGRWGIDGFVISFSAPPSYNP